MRDRFKTGHCLALMFIVLAPFTAPASETIITFEDYLGGVPIEAQYQALGATFAGGRTLSRTDSSLASGWPPHSGATLIYNYGNDDITVSAYGQSWSQAGGYITYGGYDPSVLITLQAFDATDNLLGSVSTLGPNVPWDYYIARGIPIPNPPWLAANHYLSITAPGIAYVTFSPGGGNNSFTLDDFTFVSVPEPGVWSLTALLLLAVTIRRIAMQATPHE